MNKTEDKIIRSWIKEEIHSYPKRDITSEIIERQQKEGHNSGRFFFNLSNPMFLAAFIYSMSFLLVFLLSGLLDLSFAFVQWSGLRLIQVYLSAFLGVITSPLIVMSLISILILYFFDRFLARRFSGA